MLNSKVLVVLLVAVAYNTVSCKVVADSYEELISYQDNPWCKPSILDKGIKCSAVKNPIEIQGGLVSISFI